MGNMGASSVPVSGLAKFYLMMTQQFFILLSLLAIIFTGYILWRMVISSPSQNKMVAQKKVRTKESHNHFVLRIGLGVLWLVDGLLQAQPAMSSDFVSGVIQPIAAVQPSFLAQWLQWAGQIWSSHPIFYDLLAMWIQLGIGCLLLIGGEGIWSKIGLVASLGWGTVVWIFGEGFGGLFSGSATWLSGSPGSVLFYMIAAFILLLPRAWFEANKLRLPMQRAIGILWIVLAVLQALPNQHFWTAKGLGAPILAMAKMPQPHVFTLVLVVFADQLIAHPILWNGFFTIIMLFFGIFLLFRSSLHYTWWAMGVWLFATWFLGQDFGVLGGLGTDPNSAPPLALLIVSSVILRHREDQVTKSNERQSMIHRRFFVH